MDCYCSYVVEDIVGSSLVAYRCEPLGRFVGITFVVVEVAEVVVEVVEVVVVVVVVEAVVEGFVVVDQLPSFGLVVAVVVVVVVASYEGPSLGMGMGSSHNRMVDKGTLVVACCCDVDWIGGFVGDDLLACCKVDIENKSNHSAS